MHAARCSGSRSAMRSGRPTSSRTSSSRRIRRSRPGRRPTSSAAGRSSSVAGQITDDTQLAVCLARSLHERRTLDPDDLARRYLAWSDDAFDIGAQTRGALDRLEQRNDRPARPGLAVVALARSPAGGQWLADADGADRRSRSQLRPDALVDAAIADSLITHADPRCLLACAAFDAAIAAAIREPIDGPGMVEVAAHDARASGSARRVVRADRCRAPDLGGAPTSPAISMPRSRPIRASTRRRSTSIARWASCASRFASRSGTRCTPRRGATRSSMSRAAAATPTRTRAIAARCSARATALGAIPEAWLASRARGDAEGPACVGRGASSAPSARARRSETISGEIPDEIHDLVDEHVIGSA